MGLLGHRGPAEPGTEPEGVGAQQSLLEASGASKVSPVLLGSETQSSGPRLFRLNLRSRTALGAAGEGAAD